MPVVEARDYFFLSVAAQEDPPWVKRFHADLERELRVLEGDWVTGVLDSRLLVRKSTPRLRFNAAARLPAMVALCSDRYFSDEWCGFEWATFTARLRRLGVPPPGNCLIPVVWRRPTRDWPNLPGVPDLAGRDGMIEMQRATRALSAEYYAAVRETADRVSRARSAELANLNGKEIDAVRPAFGLPRPAPVSSTSSGRARRPSAGAGSTDRPAGPLTETAGRTRAVPVPSRIGVSFVGADQPWADWLTRELTERRHPVVQLRWDPLGGERLTAMLSRKADDLDFVIALLSGSYCAFRPDQPDGPGQPDDWTALTNEGSDQAPRVLRVRIDNKPLPEPLRSASNIDVSELAPHALSRVFQHIGSVAHADVTPLGEPGRGPLSSPPVWNSPVPYEFFTGHDRKLVDVAELLTSNRHVVLVAQDRLPDLGETEVAIEYCHRYRLRYQVIWWMACNPQASRNEQFRQLMRNLDAAGIPFETRLLPDGGQVPHTASDWLFVLVGATGPDDIRRYVSEGTGHVLAVAGRAEGNWGDQVVSIGPFTRPESVALLTQTAPMLDPVQADRIANTLGDRPELLAEVAGYLVRQEIPVDLLLHLLSASVSRADLSIDLVHRLLAISPSATLIDAPPGQEVARRPGPLPRPVAGWPDSTTVPGPDNGTGAAGTASANRAKLIHAEPPTIRLGTVPVYSPQFQVSPRDMDTLFGVFANVEYVNEPEAFRRWLAVLTSLLGRQPDLPRTSVHSTRLMALLEEAVSQFGPGMLDAMARAFEALPPTAATVAFRKCVENIRPRWGYPRDATDDGEPLFIERIHEPPTIILGSAPRVDDPPFYFFTSYARRPERELVVRFHHLIQAELSRRITRDTHHHGFLDLLSMEGGAHWRAELQDASRTARIMLALMSDDYFTSDWCGREWAVFRERAHLAGRVESLRPAAIIPIPWLPVTGTIPDCVSEVQHMAVDQISGRELAVMDLIRTPGHAAQHFIIRLAMRMMDIARAPLPTIGRAQAEALEPVFGGVAK